MKYPTLLLLSLTSASQGALIITELVYDVCNSATTLNDGNGGNNGEYVIITNTASSAIDVAGFELDDDGDATDGDGMVIDTNGADPGFGSLTIGANSVLIFAGTDQTQWEAEYGSLQVDVSFYNINDAGLDWQALNNGGDNVAFTDATNNGSYSDLTGDGEALIWDGTDFVLAGNVSLTCGTQEYVPGTSGLAVAPEPSTALLGVLAGLTLLVRRRRI